MWLEEDVAIRDSDHNMQGKLFNFIYMSQCNCHAIRSDRDTVSRRYPLSFVEFDWYMTLNSDLEESDNTKSTSKETCHWRGHGTWAGCDSWTGVAWDWDGTSASWCVV